MRVLSIGEFARASRLSPKALRRYDRLGLLPPARVDPVTGYRGYAPDQLARARLVARLRRLGMPLARVRMVCELPPEAAARQVRAFWAGVEADTAARRALAAFLVDHLSGKDTAMNQHTTPGSTRQAARRSAGLVREVDQDHAHADARLLAVADGFGPGGADASAVAIGALTGLDADIPADDVLDALAAAVERANRAVARVGAAGPPRPAAALSPTGTTLTAMLWADGQIAIAHIGDSRAYLARDGELLQITHDHTVVRSLLDQGRISPEDVAAHPDRSLLLRALDGRPDATPDLCLRQARAGDRYLLCSDGLSAVVPTGRIHHALVSAADPDQAARELIALAHHAGAPDNVACAVADAG